MSIELVMLSNHLIFCHPLLLLPLIFPSIRVFSSESVLCTKWPKYWSFSFSISPSNEYLGLISFRIDWFDQQGYFFFSFSSVQFSCSVVFNSWRPHGLQQARPSCPSATPGVYSNSCPLSRWCHPTISSSFCPLLLLPSIIPSIRVLSNESVLHIRWPKC